VYTAPAFEERRATVRHRKLPRVSKERKITTILALTSQAARIKEISAFRSPELFPPFGLREQLTNDGGATTAPAPTPPSYHISVASLRPNAEDAP
jgi:hypothetical protein